MTLALLIWVAPGCRRSEPDGPVAVTNTFLQCAVAEFLGDADSVQRLCEPGMCPSHVELRPSQVEQLRRRRLLLRFDFQRGMDRRMRGLRDKGLAIAEVSFAGGICRPESYVEACRQVADALVAAGLLGRAEADARLAAVAERMVELGRECHRELRALAGAAVMASEHQADFCRWLGLDVAAIFTSADRLVAGRLDEGIAAAEAASVRFIIANEPEGEDLAISLADRLGARELAFANFPGRSADGEISYDRMVRDNVRALQEAAARD